MRDCYVNFKVDESKFDWLIQQKELYPFSGYNRIGFWYENMLFVNGIHNNFFKISDDYKRVSIIFFGEPVDIYRVYTIQSVPIKRAVIDDTPLERAAKKYRFNMKYIKKIKDENAAIMRSVRENVRLPFARRWYDDLPR